MNMKCSVKLNRCDIINQTSLYKIYMVINDGCWYVVDKATGVTNRFSFRTNTYSEVLTFADNLA